MTAVDPQPGNRVPIMARDKYARWWLENTDDDGELLAHLPEPVATLAAHVMALQERIGRLPDPNDPMPNAWSTQCCCAYDDPRDVCMTHEGHARQASTGRPA